MCAGIVLRKPKRGCLRQRSAETQSRSCKITQQGASKTRRVKALSFPLELEAPLTFGPVDADMLTSTPVSQHNGWVRNSMRLDVCARVRDAGGMLRFAANEFKKDPKNS